MAGYKYQLDVDGYGASYDGKFWKLKSGSTVFSVHAEESNGSLLLLNEQFYFPLLRDGVNFFRTTARGLPALMEWCEKNEGACMQVGAAGRQVAMCEVTPQVTLQYALLVLKHIHDMFNSTTPKKEAVP
jgi:hypothetical protein